MDSGEISLMEQKFMEFDTSPEHIGWNDEAYIRNAIYGMDVDFNKTLLMDEAYWRKKHGRNFVTSTSGIQGSGKSTFNMAWGINLGVIYGVPFTPNDIYFAHELFMSEGVEKAKPSQTLMKDEHQNTKAGMMSKIIDSNIEDAEQQTRKYQINMLFVSVNEENHAHFFTFEAKHTFFDSTGYPIRTRAVLKSPHYMNNRRFVWRGFIDFKVPPAEFMIAYAKRKDEHLALLQRKYGNTLNPIPKVAQEILEKRENELIKETREGYIRPIKAELMQLILGEEIGTRRFPMSVNAILIAKIRDLIEIKYCKYNDARTDELEKQKAELEEKKRLKIEENERKADFRRELKNRSIQARMEAEKERLLLKKQALELKQKEFLLSEQKKQEKEKRKAEEKKTKGLNNSNNTN
jgi:hypothetical protein